MVDTLVVPWAVRGVGFRGAMHIDRQPIPKQQWEGSTVRDLMACVDKHLKQRGNDGPVELVSMSLFGSRLKPNHELRSLLPALMDPFPCLLAIAHPSTASSMVSLTVKTLTGKSWSITCSAGSTVGDLQELVEKKEGTPTDQQRLIFAGRHLDAHVPLMEYNIQSGATIHLVLGLRGGTVSVPFANVADDSLLMEIAFCNEAPRWRRCDEGLNVEGRCGNRQCRTFGHMVIHPHRFDSFNLIHEKTACPICYKKITPVTCGFYNCEWAFQGVRSSDGMRMSSPWKSADGHRYHRFDATESSGTIEWTSLLITAKPLPKARCARSCSA